MCSGLYSDDDDDGGDDGDDDGDGKGHGCKPSPILAGWLTLKYVGNQPRSPPEPNCHCT